MPEPGTNAEQAMGRVIIRGFGYEVTHAAFVPMASIRTFCWPSPNYPFAGVAAPIIARCGVVPRTFQPMMIVLPDETTITCKLCAHIIDREATP